MKENSSSGIGISIMWVAGYFCTMLLYTFLDIVLWEKMPEGISNWLNIISIVGINILYFLVLVKQTKFNANISFIIDWKGILLAIGCALAFYILLDCFLDPLFESFFPSSEVDYQDTLMTLRQSPVTRFLHVCLIAPISEELLMRGFVLETVKKKHGVILALFISTILFAGLHFNMVQTLSAVISGLILGLLYAKTNSLSNTILAHALYNTISFLVILN